MSTNHGNTFTTIWDAPISQSAGCHDACVDLGPLGVVGLDPAHPILAVGARLPVTPGIAVKPVKFIVPPGLTGLTLYWQAVLTEAASPVPVTLTNAVATRF